MANAGQTGNGSVAERGRGPSVAGEPLRPIKRWSKQRKK